MIVRRRLAWILLYLLPVLAEAGERGEVAAGFVDRDGIAVGDQVETRPEEGKAR